MVYATMFDLVGSVIELLQENVQHDGPPIKSLRYELTGTLRLGDTGGDAAPFQLKGNLPPE